MADELKALLAGLAKLGSNYGANVKKLVAGGDSRQLVEIYAAGLTGVLSGLGSILGEAYDQLPAEKKADFDRLVQVSGMLEMLAQANATIGEGSFNDLATLHRASDIFDKIARILRDIFNKLGFGGGGPGTTTGKQRDWVDNLIDWGLLLLRNLIGASAPKAGGTGFHVMASFTRTMIGCEWFELYNDPGRSGMFFINHPGDGSNNELEVEMDGVVHSMTPPDLFIASGKKIRLHLKGDRNDRAKVTVTEYGF